MLLRRAAAAAPDGGEPGAGPGRPRLFAVPRLLVSLARCGAAASPDCDLPAARSPTSPLGLRAFAALGGSLLRSPGAGTHTASASAALSTPSPPTPPRAACSGPRMLCLYWKLFLLVFLAVKLMLVIEWWLGVASAVSLVPASIMILFLTRLLKNEFLAKYTRSNMENNIGVEFLEKHTGSNMKNDVGVEFLEKHTRSKTIEE